MPFNIGPLQLVLLLVILLVVFGARRLPELGRALGSGAREFKEGITGETPDPGETRPEPDQAAASDPPALTTGGTPDGAADRPKEGAQV